MKLPSEKRWSNALTALMREEAGKGLSAAQSRDLEVCERYMRERLADSILRRFPAAKLRSLWGFEGREGPQRFRRFCSNHGLESATHGQNVDLAAMLELWKETADRLFPPTQGRLPEGSKRGFKDVRGPWNQAAGSTSDGDDLVNWRAKREKLRYYEQAGRLVDKESILPKILQAAGVIRGCCLELRQRFGEEASAVVVRAIKEAEQRIMEANEEGSPPAAVGEEHIA